MTLRAKDIALRRFRWSGSFGADRRGTTAVEFGLLAVPFLGLFMALFQIGFYFFWSEQLQASVQSASRNLMTGVAQTNAKKQNITIYTIGVSVPGGDKIDARGVRLLTNCATSANNYYQVADLNSLTSAFQQIASGINALRLSQ